MRAYAPLVPTLSILPPHRRALAAAVAATLLLAATACSGGGGDEPDGGGGGADGSGSAAHTGREGDGWTVLHYSMADTNLEPFMVGDVNELGTVGSNDNLHVREFIDRSADYGDDELLDQGSWVGARVLDLGAPGTSELVEDLGDVNAADPEVLATFIAEGLSAHRAGHYALVISDHGASWPGMGPDEGSDYDVLDLAEMTAGIASGLEQAGVDKLDLIGFDACLMAGYEVASAMAPLADRMVASQELEPGHGWDYAALQVLADDPDATSDDLGAAILDGFQAQAEASGTQDSITLAHLDLTRMAAVDEALADFGGALSESAAEVAPVVGRAEASTLAFAKSPDESESSHLIDLGSLAATIGAGSEDVAEQADALVGAIDEVVLDEVAGVSTEAATGLSIYFPATADLADGAYQEVATAQPWVDFLTTYYDAGAAIPAEEAPAFLDPDGAAEVEFADDGVYLTGTYDELGQANLTDAVISYALVEDDGSLTYLGEESASIDPDGEPVASGFYDLTALSISDGEDSAYAYVSLDYAEGDDVFTVDVPMAYYAPDDVAGETYQDALLSLTLDVASGDVLSETYYAYDEASGGYGEFAPEPDGIIVPEVLNVAADGSEAWTPTTEVGLYADVANLSYDLEPLGSGTPLQVDLTVFDYGDNSSTVSAYLEAP